MPNKSDIINAVNNLDSFLKVKELKGATVKKNQNGQPFFFTGGFNMVFQLEKKSTKWAFRVWYIYLQNLKVRFQKIAKYLTSNKLSYFADFIYDENGLLVNGTFIDTIRMVWVDGLLLKDYLKLNLQNKQKLVDLAKSFLEMCNELHKNKISHGDLQHGNIIIDKSGNIKLIDYDSICVPDIEGEEELIAGLKGYQHPTRLNSKNLASLKVDFFSELIIYISIIALAENSSLWNEYNVEATEVLLFDEEDFTNITQSKIYNSLLNISSYEIKVLLGILTEYLNKQSYLDIVPVEVYLVPPTIIHFSVDKDVIISGQKVYLSWEIKNAFEIIINNGIGKVNNANDQIEIFPSQNTNFKIQAKGIGGKVEQEIFVKVFPTPIIESLKIPMPDFTSRFSLSSVVLNPPNINVSINLPDFNFNIPEYVTPNIPLNRIKPEYKPKMSIFNFSKLYERIRKKSKI
jgi:serine/threonine protein kinase